MFIKTSKKIACSNQTRTKTIQNYQLMMLFSLENCLEKLTSTASFAASKDQWVAKHWPCSTSDSSYEDASLLVPWTSTGSGHDLELMGREIPSEIGGVGQPIADSLLKGIVMFGSELNSTSEARSNGISL